MKIEAQNRITIAELLNLMIRQDSYIQTVWNSPVEIDRDSMILCNEVDIGLKGGLNSSVQEGDVITIVPLVHGG